MEKNTFSEQSTINPRTRRASLNSRYDLLLPLSTSELKEKKKEVRELIDDLLSQASSGGRKDTDSGFNSKAKKLANRVVGASNDSGNRTGSEYITGIRDKVNALPTETAELIELLGTFDFEKLREAFHTNLWRDENVQIPASYKLINELIYIIKLYWNGAFDNMNSFLTTLHDIEIHKKSREALIDNRDTEKCAQVMSGYKNVNFTDTGRANLKEAIEKLLDTEEIDKMPPQIIDKILSFHTTDGRIANFKFTRDQRTLGTNDHQHALLWQANEFHAALLHALIQLSKTKGITIDDVQLKTDTNRDFLRTLDPRIQVIYVELMERFSPKNDT